MPMMTGTRSVNFFRNLSRRSVAAAIALVVLGGAVLFWGRGFIGFADGQTGRKELSAAGPDATDAGKVSDGTFVDLSEKQAAALKIDVVGSRDFTLFKTSVGNINFNEDLLVQVF